MQFNFEDIGANKKKLSVEIPAENVRAEQDKTIKMMNKQAKIKGFRPGKVPASMIKRMFGAQIQQEVTEKLMNEALPEALKQVDRAVVSKPVLEDSHYAEDEPFRFSFTFEVKPKFEITGYEGLELTQELLNVTEEMVDNKIGDLRKAYASTRSIEADRPLAAGDLAIVDYQAYTDEGELEGGANTNYQLELGSGAFNLDFEKGLEGLKKGEAKEITVAFPGAHYNPKLAGRTIRFEVKLVDIKEKIIPELNDDFVKDLGLEIGTVDQLRERLRVDLTQSETKRINRLVDDQIKDKLSKLVEMEIPESLINQEAEGMVSTTRFNLRRSGLSMEAMGMTEAKLREDYRPEAQKQVKIALILDKIAEYKKIKVEEEEIGDKLKEVARDMGQTPELIKDFYNKNNLMDSLREGLATEKTLKYLRDNATIHFIDQKSPAETSGPAESPVT